MYEKFFNNMQKKLFKVIKRDFTASLNPFNQNLNYEKILRFSDANISVFF
jgi:hypothetical protein